MDEREARQKRLSVEQGTAIERLTQHGDWAFFMGYMEAARDSYFKALIKETNRSDHTTLARSAEGYDAINSIIEAIPKFIKAGHTAEKELYEVEYGTRKDNGETSKPSYEPITGRSLK